MGQLNGLRRLQDVLQSEYGLGVQDWHLEVAQAASDDGRVIVGTGINPDGNREAWVVTLPEPSGTQTQFAVLVAIVVLTNRVRQSSGAF